MGIGRKRENWYATRMNIILWWGVADAIWYSGIVPSTTALGLPAEKVSSHVYGRGKHNCARSVIMDWRMISWSHWDHISSKSKTMEWIESENYYQLKVAQTEQFTFVEFNGACWIKFINLSIMRKAEQSSDFHKHTQLFVTGRFSVQSISQLINE